MAQILNFGFGKRSVKNNLIYRSFKNFCSKEKYIMSIDQGTTSSRAILISKELKVVGTHQESHSQITEHPGWVSHDPMEIYTQVVKCIQGVMQKTNISKSQIQGVGITNQRETTVVWDKVTGKPLQNAIVWLDKRNEKIVNKVIADAGDDRFKYSSKTGLPISSYFSALKMKWFLSNENPNISTINEALNKGRLCFGTIDSWLIYWLTKGKSFTTDLTNASRTMLMDIVSLEWDQSKGGMLDVFDIKQDCLPSIIKVSCSDFGTIEEECLRGVEINGVIGDQQSACLGHLLKKGEVKSTYGTGCFILCNTGDKIVHSKHGLLTTALYKLGENQPTNYALEGAVEWGGSTMGWARDKMKLYKDIDELNEILSTVNDSDGVYFIPAFSGLFSPYWRDDIKGTIFGLTHHSTRGHIVKALTNSILMRCKQVVDVMEKDWEGTINLSTLNVDGGLSENPYLMQTQSEFLNKSVITKEEKELTAIGAGIAAGLKTSFWKDLDEIRGYIKIKNAYSPKLDDKIREKNEKKWLSAVDKALGWKM